MCRVGSVHVVVVHTEGQTPPTVRVDDDHLWAESWYRGGVGVSDETITSTALLVIRQGNSAPQGLDTIHLI